MFFTTKGEFKSEQLKNSHVQAAFKEKQKVVSDT